MLGACELPTTLKSTPGQGLLGLETMGMFQICPALTCAALPSSLVSLQAPLNMHNPQ